MSFDQYKLLDSGDGKKLEQVGPYVLIRPASPCFWKPKKNNRLWSKADAEFIRKKDGDGTWIFHNKKMAKSWSIRLGEQQMQIQLTNFGHLGIFPEHLHHEQFVRSIVENSSSKQALKVLNLFAYTGALSIFMAKLGIEVVHVDASKSSIEWAKKNSSLSKTPQRKIRWILDDVQKFAKREERRNSLYHGIILDPPSFGRGPKNELWKIETHLLPLLETLKKIMHKDFRFLILSSHTPGFTPDVLTNILQEIFTQNNNITSQEMLINEEKSTRKLPCGSCAIYKD